MRDCFNGSGGRFGFGVTAVGAVLALVLAANVMAAVPAPDRPLTDPTSLVSPSGVVAPAEIAVLNKGGVISGAVYTEGGRSVVVASGRGGRINLWRIPLSGGPAEQITRSEDSAFFIAASPDGADVVFSADHGGTQIFDLYIVSARGGPVRNLTQTAGVSEYDPKFSPDGKRVAFLRQANAEPSSNVALLDLPSGRITVLSHEADPKRLLHPFAWSPDGKFVYANRGDFLGNKSDIWRFDVADGTATDLTRGSAGKVAGSAVSPDGRKISVQTDQNSDHFRAGILDITSGTIKFLDDSKWDEEVGLFSPDGRFLVYSEAEDSRVVAHVYDFSHWPRARREAGGRSVGATQLAQYGA